MNIICQSFAFAPGNGAVAEYHILLSVGKAALPYEEQLAHLLQAYREASAGKTVQFRRFFLSDGANQADALREALEAFPSVPTSIVGQAPLDGTRIALWMYCTSPMDAPGGIPSHNGYSHHWVGSLVSPGAGPEAQMGGIFRTLDRSLGERGLCVARDTVRTWIFVRDADVNYAGVVTGRRDYFTGIGLTPATHFIASTGIEGRHPDHRNLVEMDAYSVGGLGEGQVRYLHALDHLSPTAVYGVTFERGTAITYGDRQHLFISGTASIDAEGQVLYPGDASLQARRMLENISALLAEGGAGLGDIAAAIVYLRDPADYPLVKETVSGICPNLRALYVHGPVCRPAWLVEMECLVVTPSGDSAFKVF